MTMQEEHDRHFPHEDHAGKTGKAEHASDRGRQDRGPVFRAASLKSRKAEAAGKTMIARLAGRAG